MITPKPLLSENVKDFMDYALDVIQSMNGAPEHTAKDKALVDEKLSKLSVYLDNVASSYHETVPQVSENSDSESLTNFSGTGHS